MNAYEMLEQVRYNIGETTEAHWKDKMLLRQLNMDHREVARKILDAPGDWLLKKSDSLTPSSSQLSLPSDCVKPAAIEEVSSGRVIPVRGTVRERRVGRMAGTSLSAGTVEAYLIGNKIEVNMDSYGEACYVWYQKRVIDLHAGLCGSSTDATHVQFELTHWPSGEDDYYNGVTVQVRDQSDHILNVDAVITDYTGQTASATITSAIATPASGDYYGTVSQLPVEVLPVVLLRSTVKALARPSSTFEKEIFSFYLSELKRAEEELDEFLATRISGSTYSRIVEVDHG